MSNVEAKMPFCLRVIKKIAAWIFWITVILFVIKQGIYRFKHPEMTETQLFINMFDVSGDW